MEKEELKKKFTHKNITEHDDVIYDSGKFFIGDPGYTMDDDGEWRDYIMHHRIPGVYNDKYKKINYDLSDAVYYDQWGNMYGVDCGLFGISCVDGLDDCKIEHLERLGVIVDVKEVIHTYFVDKKIYYRDDDNCINDGEKVRQLKIVIDNNDEYFIDFIRR